MRRFIPLNFVSSLLLLVMLAITLQGSHESAHAMQSPVSGASSIAVAPAPHDVPCSPFEHHHDFDDCDNCVNCACHASLTIQSIQLSYNPAVSELQTFDTFKFIPEVYLPRFIPPQIQA